MSDAPSFQKLVEEHYAMLYRFALSLTRHEAEAEDLTQQAFLTWAFEGHQLRAPSKAGTWLFTTLQSYPRAARRRGDASWCIER